MRQFGARLAAESMDFRSDIASAPGFTAKPEIAPKYLPKSVLFGLGGVAPGR